MLASTSSGVNGITAQAASAGAMHSTGAEQKKLLVGAAGNDDFLHHQLQAVRNRLQQPQRADAVGSDTHLHVADHLALGVGDIGHAQQQRADDDDDLHQRPHHWPERPQQGLKEFHQIRPSLPQFRQTSNPGRQSGDGRSDPRTTRGQRVIASGTHHRTAAALAHHHHCAVLHLQVAAAGRRSSTASGAAPSRLRCSESARRTTASAW